MLGVNSKPVLHNLSTPGINDRNSFKQLSAMPSDRGFLIHANENEELQKNSCADTATRVSPTRGSEANSSDGEQTTPKQPFSVILEPNHESIVTHECNAPQPPTELDLLFGQYVDRFGKCRPLMRIPPSPPIHGPSNVHPLLTNGNTSRMSQTRNGRQRSITFPTVAKKDEICRLFRSQRGCPWRKRCFRIHRLDIAPSDCSEASSTPQSSNAFPKAQLDEDGFQDLTNTFETSHASVMATSSKALSPLRSPHLRSVHVGDDTIVPVVKLPASNKSQNVQQARPAESGHDPLISTSLDDEVFGEKLISIEQPLLEDTKPCDDVVVPPRSSESSDSMGGNVIDKKDSDRCWNPQTGFWGWPPDDSAWVKTSQCSDSSASDRNGFSSSSMTSSEPSESPPTPIKHPMPPSSETCRKWLRNDCSLGYCCRFVHGDLEYDVQPQPLNMGTTAGPQSSQRDETMQSSSLHPHKPLLTSWLVVIHGHIRVKFGAGFEVKEVTTGFETPWIFMDNIPSSATLESITQALEAFGQVDDARIHRRTTSSSMTIKARFSTAVEALQATAALNGAQLFNSRISVRLPVNNTKSGNTTFEDTAVRVEWEAPGKTGYGGYPNIRQANEAIAATVLPLRGYHVSASVHVGLPAIAQVTVRFRGLPLDSNAKDMERFAHPEDVVWGRPNYSSLPSAVASIRKMLEECGDLVSFEVLPPPYRDGMVRAWARFSSPVHAKAASSRLHGRKPRFTGMTTISARHVQVVTYTLSPDAYNKVAPAIRELRESIWQRCRHGTISVIHRDPNPCVLIKLFGADRKELGQVKSEFEKILSGETLRQDGRLLWDGFFSTMQGHAYLRNLESQNPGISIYSDPPKRTLKLFGSPTRREVIRQTLISIIVKLRSQRPRRIPLYGRLVGVLMSPNLLALQQKFGPENVILNLHERVLIVRGSDEAYHAAQEAIHLAQRGHPNERCPRVVECPVCFDEATSPIKLGCGHTWCRDCLSNYLIATTDNTCFPLTCLGGDAKCSEPIPISAAREILSPSDFQSVLSASFSSHVHSRPDEFHYCPTPDCLQIYRTAPQDAMLQCPSCLLRICPSCHAECHDGFDCPDRDGGDKLFKEWAKKHDVKNCPSCKVPIERAEGCNHMTCSQCQTHICWVCLETFPKGEGIYDHMRSKHGGIGLGVGL